MCISSSKCLEQMLQRLRLLVKISNQRLKQSESFARESLSVEGWPVSVKTNGSWWLCLFSSERKCKTGTSGDRATLTGSLNELVQSTKNGWASQWSTLKITHDSHPYNPWNKSSKGVNAQAQISIFSGGYTWIIFYAACPHSLKCSAFTKVNTLQILFAWSHMDWYSLW